MIKYLELQRTLTSNHMMTMCYYDEVIARTSQKKVSLLFSFTKCNCLLPTRSSMHFQLYRIYKCRDQSFHRLLVRICLVYWECYNPVT